MAPSDSDLLAAMGKKVMGLSASMHAPGNSPAGQRTMPTITTPRAVPSPARSTNKENTPLFARPAAPTIKITAPTAKPEPAAPTIKITPPPAEPEPAVPTIKITPPAAEPEPAAPTIKITPPAAEPEPTVTTPMKTSTATPSIINRSLNVPQTFAGPSLRGTPEQLKEARGFQMSATSSTRKGYQSKSAARDMLNSGAGSRTYSPVPMARKPSPVLGAAMRPASAIPMLGTNNTGIASTHANTLYNRTTSFTPSAASSAKTESTPATPAKPVISSAAPAALNITQLPSTTFATSNTSAKVAPTTFKAPVTQGTITTPVSASDKAISTSASLGASGSVTSTPIKAVASVKPATVTPPPSALKSTSTTTTSTPAKSVTFASPISSFSLPAIPQDLASTDAGPSTASILTKPHVMPPHEKKAAGLLARQMADVTSTLNGRAASTPPHLRAASLSQASASKAPAIGDTTEAAPLAAATPSPAAPALSAPLEPAIADSESDSSESDLGDVDDADRGLYGPPSAPTSAENVGILTRLVASLHHQVAGL
ncbi:hypothetical protein LTR53_016298, partial [Teratosphaeriaceae sp. CCFEE 6253]